MQRFIILGVLGILVAGLGCVPQDPLAAVKKEYPGATEYCGWKSYVLIRYAAEPETGVRPALIVQRQDRGYVKLAESREGFRRLNEVILWVPEMDESGVQAWGLR